MPRTSSTPQLLLGRRIRQAALLGATFAPQLVVSICEVGGLGSYHCSGHGYCETAKKQCVCYEGYGSPTDRTLATVGIPSNDCSHRVCPSGKAWVDVPTSDTAAHAVAECSNQGICDRSKGDCACFAGFTGDACQRMFCPSATSAECSGHGRCVSMKRLAEQTNALPLSAATTYTGAEAGETWDEEKIYGCICDSGWTVGLGSGQTQEPQYFGPDCSFKRCPSGDDPITDMREVTTSVHAQGSYYDTDKDPVDFSATGVLTDNSDNQGSIWLGPDGANSDVTLKLDGATLSLRGSITQPFRVSAFKVRNTKNSLQTKNVYAPKDARTTVGYTIQLSPDASTWTTAATGSLNPYDLTLQTITPSVDMEAQYVKFSITSYAGAGGGLGYLGVFINDDETDCSYVPATGGFGTGAAFNKCHKDCAGRGICEYLKGECTCFPGFSGEDCTRQNIY